jgi:hypothetical protein
MPKAKQTSARHTVRNKKAEKKPLAALTPPPVQSHFFDEHGRDGQFVMLVGTMTLNRVIFRHRHLRVTSHIDQLLSAGVVASALALSTAM